MRRVALIGVASDLGNALVNSALDAGHLVHAVVKDPRAFTRQKDEITTFVVDPHTGEGLGAALQGCHYVVFALQPWWPQLARMLGHATRELAGKSSLARLAFVSRSVGSLKDPPGLLLRLKNNIPLLAAALRRDAVRAEGIVRTAGLPYVIIRPTRVTKGPRLHKVVAVGPRERRPGSLTAGELADFAIRTLGDDAFAKKEVVVGATSEKAEVEVLMNERDMEESWEQLAARLTPEPLPAVALPPAAPPESLPVPATLIWTGTTTTSTSTGSPTVIVATEDETKKPPKS